MNKHRKALVIAFAMTFFLSLGMFLIGGAALLNPNGVPVAQAASNVKASGQAVPASAQSDLQTRVSQLESLVSQYQQREKQYQDQLAAVQSQLNDSQSQVNQYQQILQFLVDRGVLRVNNNGQLMLGGN